MKQLIFLCCCISFLFSCNPNNFKPSHIDPSEPLPSYTPPLPSNPNIKKCEGNVESCSTELLCAGGIGKGRKILFIDADLSESSSTSMAQQVFIPDLKQIQEYTGIDYDYSHYDFSTHDFSSTVQKLNNNEYDAIWFISHSYSEIDPNLLSAIQKKVKQGVGLALFGENGSIATGADIVLKNIKPDWNLKFETEDWDGGNGKRYYAAKGNTGSKVLYDHPVTSGIYKNVDQGVTISYFLPRDSSKTSIIDKTDLYKPILLDSDSHISVSAVEEEVLDGLSGYSRVRTKNGKIIQRTLMHGGHTAFLGWGPMNAPGATAMFFFNIACWTSGAQ